MGRETDNETRTVARRIAPMLFQATAVCAAVLSWSLPASAASTASAAPAVTTVDFAATASPLSFGGYGYSDLISGDGSGAIFIPASDTGSTEVTTDGTSVPGVPGDPGLYDFDVALVRAGDSYLTLYIDAAMYEYYTGGPYPHTCSGTVALLTTLNGEVPPYSCDNFAKSILTANAPYEDFTFTGFAGFEYGGPVTAVAGYSDPALTFIGVPPPYYASATPLSFEGVDYDEVSSGDDSRGETTKSSAVMAIDAAGASAGGALWVTDFEDSPQFVTSDNTTIAGIPDSDEQRDIDAILLDIRGAKVTVYMTSAWRAEAKGGPYDATCGGFLTFLRDMEDDAGFTCANFRAGIFEANGAGEDFTFTGFDDFANAGEVRAVTGYSSPPWLTYGSYTPAVTTTTTTTTTTVASTTSTSAPASTTTAAATTTVAPTTSTTIAPVTATTAASSAATLPATGSESGMAAALVGIILLGVGAALLRSARDVA